MANYWIVVPRGNSELFDLLSVAFRGHTGFNVVVDRRRADSPPALSESKGALNESKGDAEPSGGRVPLGPDEIVVAERAERADGPATGGEAFRSFQHIPVRRRRVRRPASRTGSDLQQTPPLSGTARRAVTAC